MKSFKMNGGYKYPKLLILCLVIIIILIGVILYLVISKRECFEGDYNNTELKKVLNSVSNSNQYELNESENIFMQNNVKKTIT